MALQLHLLSIVLRAAHYINHYPSSSFADRLDIDGFIHLGRHGRLRGLRRAWVGCMVSLCKGSSPVLVLTMGIRVSFSWGAVSPSAWCGYPRARLTGAFVVCSYLNVRLYFGYLGIWIPIRHPNLASDLKWKIVTAELSSTELLQSQFKKITCNSSPNRLQLNC